MRSCTASRRSRAAMPSRRRRAIAASRSTAAPPPTRSGAASRSREFDAEGRYVEARFGKLWVISVYMPSGSAGPHRQASKFRFLKRFLVHLQRLRERGHEVILCGDWNIAHQEIDLTNWRSNQKNSGFLPEERAWLTRVFDELGFVDVFRRLNPKPGAVHLVVQPRPGVGEERGLAHRLPDRHARASRRLRARSRSTRRSGSPTTRPDDRL